MWPTDTSPINQFLWLLAFATLALLYVALIAREVVSRIRAGPVRFRLPPASLARPPQRITATARGAFLLMLLFIVLSISDSIMSKTFSPGSVCILLVWFSMYNQPRLRRRGANRWPVLASGLFTLVIGAMLLARGLRVIQLGDPSAYGLLCTLMLIYPVIFVVIGAGAIQESISGTRVRERGIKMSSWTHPWSRVVVKDWQAREGGFALHLSILPPQGFLSMQLRQGGEITVPVPASERPALEVFLAGHTATAG